MSEEGRLSEDGTNRVPEVLRAVADGEATLSDDLIPLLYDRLRGLARRRLAKEPPGQTLQTTDLVHEAYLRLVDDSHRTWDGRRHFFGAAAQAIRRILVDRARARGRVKRGGGRRRVPLEDGFQTWDPDPNELLALEDALEGLQAIDERKCEIATLRVFVGFTNDETAELLGVSRRTVEDEWRFTRVWLKRELQRGLTGEPHHGE